MSYVSLQTQIFTVAFAATLGACGSSTPELIGAGGSSGTSTTGTTTTGTTTTGTTTTGGTTSTGSGGGSASCGAIGPVTGAPGFGAPAQDGAGTSTEKYSAPT